VRLIDLLDAITKVADPPVQYSIEDYAVVLTLASSFSSENTAFVSRRPEAVPLAANTFMVSSNDFIIGVEKTFGVKIDMTQPHLLQRDLRQFLARLGINMDVSGKSAFYNDRNGILMVRATPADLELLAIAVATLGGTAGNPSPVTLSGSGDGEKAASVR
jgi:hypothetical protein